MPCSAPCTARRGRRGARAVSQGGHRRGPEKSPRCCTHAASPMDELSGYETFSFARARLPRGDAPGWTRAWRRGEIHGGGCWYRRCTPRKPSRSTSSQRTSVGGVATRRSQLRVAALAWWPTQLGGKEKFRHFLFLKTCATARNWHFNGIGTPTERNHNTHMSRITPRVYCTKTPVGDWREARDGFFGAARNAVMRARAAATAAVTPQYG